MPQIKPLDFQSGPKGFGTGTHLSQKIPKWKNEGQVPNHFGPKLKNGAPNKTLRFSIWTKSVWHWDTSVPKIPKWKNEGQVPNHFGPKLKNKAPNKTFGFSIWIQRVWHWDTSFPK